MLGGMHLFDLDGELTSLSLVVPLANPVGRAQRGEGLPEDLARLKVLTFHSHALVVVHVVLGTVLGLVGEWESWVELRGVELEVFLVNSHYGINVTKGRKGEGLI